MVIIQQQRLLCQALVRAIEEEHDLHVIAAAHTFEKGLELSAHHPDIFVVHEEILEHAGSKYVARLKELSPDAKVLVIAEDTRRDRVERALLDGADGFTVTGVTFSEFLDTIRHVSAGDLILHPAATTAIVRSFSDSLAGKPRSTPQLTARQTEILRLMALGEPNKAIARRLGIGIETVKTHISRIMDKLSVGSRTEAVTSAIRMGLLAPAALDEQARIMQREEAPKVPRP